MQEPAATTARVFLFLQGPHGPFFDRLATQLRAAGASTWRVGFNAGDSVFWRDRTRYIAHRGSIAEWPGTLDKLMLRHGVTDVVIYGDTRPVHALAIARARQSGVRIHVFEEGYLRPYWITYERGGANGHSPLMQLSIAQITSAIGARAPARQCPPPAHWGDVRQHVFYGALYHWFVLFWNHNYPQFCTHRSLSVGQEFRLYLKRLVLMPLQAMERRIATLRISCGSFPYHLALLQLEHDSAFQMHGPFATQAEFLTHVIDGFAAGAPAHHHLVFKAHPLEDDRSPMRRTIKHLAQQARLADRVHFIRGGKLAGLLDHARSAVTVNSTAGQQALWRGLPLRAFGSAVYTKPELVSSQPLAEFFAVPDRPDAAAYRMFRLFLLSTSQVPGSFYARRGRKQILRHIVDRMLDERAPYDRISAQTEALGQQLRVVNERNLVEKLAF